MENVTCSTQLKYSLVFESCDKQYIISHLFPRILLPYPKCQKPVSFKFKCVKIMTRKHQRKPPFFQFGNPVEIKTPGAIQANLKINFRDKFISWFGINNTAPDLEKINKILPSVLRVNLRNPSSDGGTKSKKSKAHTQLLIDLNKLEAHDSICKKDKVRIRKILEDIKCNKIEKEGKAQIKRKVKKVSPNYKSSESFSKKEKQRLRREKCTGKVTKTNRRINSSRTPKKVISECKQCSKMLAIENKPKRKEKIPSTTISISQDKIFKTLIGLDPRCFGDTMAIQNKKPSSSTITSIYTDKQNINIKNIELKYLNPTYVVQYNTNKNGKDDDSDEDDVPRPRRDRLFSSAVIEAHLGGGPPIQYNDGKARGQSLMFIKPMHYETPSTEHIIGGGLSAEDQRTIKDKSHLRVLAPRDSDDEVELTSSYRSPDRARWQRDPLPSYLLPNDQRANSVSLEQSPFKQKKNTMCKKCLNFLKKVLCLKGDTIPETTRVKIEQTFTQMKKEEYLSPKGKANKAPKANLKKTRTTEDEFFNPKLTRKNENDNKQHKRSILRMTRN